jgi:hypothetical protein
VGRPARPDARFIRIYSPTISRIHPSCRVVRMAPRSHGSAFRRRPVSLRRRSTGRYGGQRAEQRGPLEPVDPNRIRHHRSPGRPVARRRRPPTSSDTVPTLEELLRLIPGALASVMTQPGPHAATGVNSRDTTGPAEPSDRDRLRLISSRHLEAVSHPALRARSYSGPRRFLLESGCAARCKFNWMVSTGTMRVIEAIW